MRSVPIVLLLAALAAGEDDAKAPALALPVAPSGVPDTGKYPHKRTTVDVDAKGFVSWRGRKLTLDGLGTVLGKLNERYSDRLRREGKKGFEELRGGGKASKVFVLLRADKDTPWLHVQWLMTILAEQKLYKLQFAVRRTTDRAAPPAKFDAFLPRDEVLPIPREPPNVIKVGVHIVARKEVGAKWGPDGLAVSKPTAFKYRMGDRTAATLEPIRKWIEDHRKAAQGAPNTKLIGEIQAGHKVPFRQVVTVLNELRAQGLKQVNLWLPLGEAEHFTPDTIPSKETRKRPYLPYPLKNYPTPR